jgi:hypothetical protein
MRSKEVRSAGSAQHSLFDCRDPGGVCADLADDARSDSAAVDPVGDIGHHLVRDLVCPPPIEIRLIVRFAIPPTTEDDLEPGALGDVLDAERILSQPAICLVDQGHPTRILVTLCLERREVRVVQDVVADPCVAHEVQQQVLVDQREAELIRWYWAGDGHDRRGHRQRDRQACRVMGRRVKTCIQFWGGGVKRDDDGCAQPAGPRARAATRYC